MNILYIYASSQRNIWRRISICVCVYACVFVCVCLSACLYICVCVCICVFVYMCMCLLYVVYVMCLVCSFSLCLLMCMYLPLIPLRLCLSERETWVVNLYMCENHTKLAIGVMDWSQTQILVKSFNIYYDTLIRL